MAFTIIQFPKTTPFFPTQHFSKHAPAPIPPSFVRLYPLNKKTVVCATFSAAGGSNANNDFNPYEYLIEIVHGKVLGVNSFMGFDKVKTIYSKKRKDAERRGDDAAVVQLERAYDQIMMSQLSKRQKGETFGSFKVSKDIKFADKLPVVPWGPRFAKSEAKDVQINLGIAAVFIAWILIKRSAEYKPLQFLAFVFVYRIFEKLKSFEPPVSPVFTEEGGEDDGRMVRMGKRLLRSLSLAFGCVAFASLGYTGVLNVVEFAAGYVPIFLYNNQELLITASAAIMLHVLASYYR